MPYICHPARNYVTPIVRNSSHSVEPPALALDEPGVDDGPVPGDERGIGSAHLEHPGQRRRPGPQIGIPVDNGISGLLDEVPTEDDGRLAARDDRDQVVIGMAPPLPARSTPPLP